MDHNLLTKISMPRKASVLGLIKGEGISATKVKIDPLNTCAIRPQFREQFGFFDNTFILQKCSRGVMKFGLLR